MRGPEPYCQRQFGPVHHCASGDRRLTTATEAFVGVRPALQQCCAPAATGGGGKPLWPTALEQKRRAARLVRQARLKLTQQARPSHPKFPSRPTLIARARHLILHNDQPPK